mmetsp:Transcript_27235/g.40326  ORF Transcript_27235/g.40326 Transcript_27235/m.40326 type:complete len:291 (+) Transcript_27235:48-920(+)
MRLYRTVTAVLVVAGSLPASSAFSVSTQIQTQSLKLPTHSFSPTGTLKVNARSFSSTRIHSSLDDDEPIFINTDPVFNGKTTIALVAGQSLLIGIAVIAAQLLSVPNFGLGQDFVLDSSSIQSGALATLPLFAIAAVLDVVEKSVPALEDVSKATQRSVLGLLGGARKPLLALVVSIGLGAAAGWGEEMLFRGVLQSELSDNIGELLALGSSAIIFGALHAVTPLYALIAGIASLYFGELFIQYHNLAVPIVCHGLYDVGALMAAHWAVSGMTEDERIALANWEPPVRNS